MLGALAQEAAESGIIQCRASISPEKFSTLPKLGRPREWTLLRANVKGFMLCSALISLSPRKMKSSSTATNDDTKFLSSAGTIFSISQRWEKPFQCVRIHWVFFLLFPRHRVAVAVCNSPVCLCSWLISFRYTNRSNVSRTASNESDRLY